ncbi:DMT family transporter [Thiorhodococcus fuscus]|uniref:DMT family transporter n=1 Tax=Thiorhodococcus fuscus TaxID=527200 RepID=A0ABW4YCF1_9GAMM
MQNPAQPSSLDGIGLSAALLTPIAWGLTGIFVRLLEELPPATIVAGRLAVGLLVLLPFLLIRRDLALAALRTPLPLAMGLYYLLATEAYARAPVVEVTLIIGTAPVIAVALQWVSGRRPSRRQILYVALALLGLVLYLAPARTAGGAITGQVLAFGCALASALYVIGLRSRAMEGRHLHPLASTAIACLWGLVITLPVLTTSTPDWPSHDALTLIAVLGLVSTVLPTLSYGLAAVRLSPLVTTAVGLLTPLFAGLAAGLVLDEWPRLASIPGAILTLAALLLLIRAGSRDRTIAHSSRSSVRKTSCTQRFLSLRRHWK